LNALDEQQKPETEEGDAQPAKTYTSRQTLLCSATLTTGIEQLSEISLKHPSMSSIVFLCFKDYVQNIKQPLVAALCHSFPHIKLFDLQSCKVVWVRVK